MAQSQIAVRGSAARRVEDIPGPPCGGLFPLTPALSLGALGERVNPFSPRSTIQTFRLSRRVARCSLSPRERVRVRGNDANHPLQYRTIPGIVELDESSGGAGVS